MTRDICTFDMRTYAIRSRRCEKLLLVSQLSFTFISVYRKEGQSLQEMKLRTSVYSGETKGFQQQIGIAPPGGLA